MTPHRRPGTTRIPRRVDDAAVVHRLARCAPVRRPRGSPDPHPGGVRRARSRARASRRTATPSGRSTWSSAAATCRPTGCASSGMPSGRRWSTCAATTTGRARGRRRTTCRRPPPEPRTVCSMASRWSRCPGPASARTRRRATRRMPGCRSRGSRRASALHRRPPVLVVSHAPPRDAGDTPTDAYHVGFAGYRVIADRLRPPLWLHGHTNPAAQADWRTTLGSTTVVNVTGSVLVELRLPAVHRRRRQDRHTATDRADPERRRGIAPMSGASCDRTLHAASDVATDPRGSGHDDLRHDGASPARSRRPAIRN